MNLEEHYRKFDKDVKKYSRGFRLLLSIDQFFNVLIWNGSQDQTISGHIGRRIVANEANWIEHQICKVLRKIQNKHCIRSRGE